VVLIQVDTPVEGKTWETETTPVGSGVVIAKDKVLTNCHVARAELDGTLRVRQTGAGEEGAVSAKPYARIEGKDLCLLKTREPIGQPALLGAASKLKVGAPVYAIGAPQGLELSFSDGVVSQLRGDKKAPLIQTTAPISPGSSGGGLFDSEGQLVGITTFYLMDSQNLNFAAPVEWLDELHRPGNRILNRAGEACEELIAESIRKSVRSDRPMPKNERDAVMQCFRLINEQMRAAFSDAVEPKPSPARPAEASPPLPELLLAGTDETDSFLTSYLKTRTLRRSSNGMVQAWVIEDFKSPRYSEVGRFYYQSRLSLFEYDCEGRRWGLLSLADYSEPMGHGRVLYSHSFAPNTIEYEYVIPGSVGEMEFKLACALAGRN
jgi:hypothetical protein